MGTANSSQSTKPLTILPHQGLGDLILCIGLFRSLLSRHSSLEILVTRKYARALSNAFSRTPNVKVISLPKFPNGLFFSRFELVSGFLLGASRQIVHREFLALGYLGREFFGVNRSLRFDESFYFQANVEFSNRWEAFLIDCLNARSQELGQALGIDNSPYIFLHEDPSRGFLIDRNFLPDGIRVVSPLPPSAGYDVWDYVELLSGAEEIHVIESSFAALVESLELPIPKFAHRYARPEAAGDWNHEFTYRSDWTILN